MHRRLHLTSRRLPVQQAAGSLLLRYFWLLQRLDGISCLVAAVTRTHRRQSHRRKLRRQSSRPKNRSRLCRFSLRPVKPDLRVKLVDQRQLRRERIRVLLHIPRRPNRLQLHHPPMNHHPKANLRSHGRLHRRTSRRKPRRPEGPAGRFGSVKLDVSPVMRYNGV